MPQYVLSFAGTLTDNLKLPQCAGYLQIDRDCIQVSRINLHDLHTKIQRLVLHTNGPAYELYKDTII